MTGHNFSKLKVVTGHKIWCFLGEQKVELTGAKEGSVCIVIMCHGLHALIMRMDSNYFAHAGYNCELHVQCSCLLYSSTQLLLAQAI